MISKYERKKLATEALKSSASLRRKWGFDTVSPISIYDLCDKAGVPVRFVDIDMEGMYVNMGEGLNPTIFLSALRPFHRKIYTCAHEYGHHHFGHGMSVDEIKKSVGVYSSEEFLVDTFASYLLVPPLALKAAFFKRGLKLSSIGALECFSIACSFGVGYSTLANHLLHNAYISKVQFNKLLSTELKSIKSGIVGERISEPLFFVDDFFAGKTIDVETASYLLLPNHFEIEEMSFFEKIKNVSEGAIFRVLKPGITRAYSLNSDLSFFVRIQKSQYIGLSRYRHLAE